VNFRIATASPFLGTYSFPKVSPERYTSHTSSMPQTTHRDREEGSAPGMYYPRISPVLAELIMSIIDGHRDHLQLTTDQPLQRESNFGDSSGPLFSIYSKAAEDEDNKMAERWQKDADGILIFVSPCVRHSYCLVHKLEYYRPVYFLLPSLPSLL
jgi:hypothetical protein